MPPSFPAPLSAATRMCAVLGHPISHSGSPAMQNAAMAELGLDWRYLAFDVHPEHLRSALEGARRMHFTGLNLTIPHKLLAVDLMDALDDSAATWGAVNTIRFEARDAQGVWRALHDLPTVPDEVRMQGFNTDAEAIARSLREDLNLELEGASVLLLGAGGAGRTAALKLAAEKAGHLHLVNRTMDKAMAIAREISHHYPSTKVDFGYPSGAVDLVLNATSLGLKPGDTSPLDESRLSLSRVKTVYDMIYAPAQTRLLQAAAAAGCRTANGVGMLVYQGARALEIWSGRTAPVALMRQALLEHLGRYS